MRRQAFVLSTALVAASTAAMAAPSIPFATHLPAGVVISASNHGSPVAINLNYFGAATHKGGTAVNNGAAIINWFSKMPNAPFVSWSGHLAGCAFGGCFLDAMAFTPPISTTSKKVTLGLMAFSKTNYTYQADVSIYSDASGLPGTALATKTVTASPAFGPCCTPLTVRLEVPLVAGTQYWLVVGPHTSTDATIWGAQDRDFVTQELTATYDGESWTAWTTNQGYSYVLK